MPVLLSSFFHFGSIKLPHSGHTTLLYLAANAGIFAARTSSSSCSTGGKSKRASPGAASNQSWQSGHVQYQRFLSDLL